LRWVLAHFQLQRLNQVIALAEDRVTTQRELLTVGRSTEQVVLEMEVRVQEHREYYAFLQREYRRLANVLRQQTGIAGDLTRFLPAELPDIQPMSLSDLEMLRRSLHNRKPQALEIERRELELRTEQEQFSILQRRHYPKIDLVAGAFADTLEGFNRDERVLRGNFFAGVAVNWNIFDGWQTRGMRMSNLARQRMQEAWIEESRGQLSSEVDRLLVELEFNIQQILTRDTRLQILQRRLDLLEQQRERELIPVVDQLELQLNFGDLSLQALESRINYLLHLAQLANLFQADPFQSQLLPR
ncbi:MAG: TolC family protein, partial [Verrucomicrobia bacterium]|nr:TolC family protein [Verrucomicrobiota bacterium]